ncbi:MAG TPA: tetratricopeptide repeat protein, partial [Thermodesulfobacteriota bacterium]|nr:tetratricopeptide repeat protein [Thermodesulfobacteriota bacterium]
LKESNEKVPDNSMMRYHLGMAYYKNGDKELAKKELKKALELEPKFSGAGEAKEALSKLE